MTIEHPNDHDTREWQAQERARREIAARDREPPSLAGASLDEALAYRAIARALRQAPPDPLPADFAARVAARCRHAHTTSAVAGDARLEQRLLRGLAVALTLSAAAAGARYGSEWLHAIKASLPLLARVDALRWMLAFAGCAALTFCLDRIGARRAPLAH